MSDLRTFLLARIAEDEEAATPSEDWSEVGFDYDVPVQFWDYGEVHIGHKRFLAECTAKQALVERHRQYRHTGFCECCFDDYPCADLRTLGAIYDQHPDYREEWRP